MKLSGAAPSLTSRGLPKIQRAARMVEVETATKDGRVLVLRRHTEPEAEQEAILQKLNLSLPDQSAPQIFGMQAVISKSEPVP